MRLESIRRSLVGSAIVVVASLLLGSCGGGGAGAPAGPVGGPPQILPAQGTLYAGVEYTFTLGGGRAPYFIGSSEPSVLPVPQRVDGNFFSVIPANTAVVDTGLPPNSLPVRTVIITMRDTVGSTAAATIQVAQNFFTGYNVFFQSNCTPATGGAAPSACQGGQTAIEVTAAINGNLYGDREYRFEVVRGPFFFVSIGPNGQVPASGTLGPGGATWTTRTDHEGDAHAIIQVNQSVPTQIGVFRVVDVATGVSTQYIFNIQGVPLSGSLTAIPDEFTLAGADSATCGTGTGDFLVFDGTPPYRAVSTFPQYLTVDPEVSFTQPGRFRFSASNPFFCLNPGTIVVTDANNQRVTVEVTTEEGSGTPPPSPILFTPGSITLSCGASGSVIITGGGTTFTAASPDSRVSVNVASRTVTITRAAVDPAGTPPSPTPGVANPISYTINVTDGTQVASIGVTAPSNCPP